MSRQGTLLDRVYELMAVCHAEASPEAPLRSRAEVEAFLRHPPEFETREVWIAESDGDCVGFGLLAAGPALPTARADVLVHPDSRRSGHGSALLETVRQRATALGASVLIGSHSTEAGSRFAAAVGATDKHREIESLLPLPVAVAVDPVSGYTLRSWVGAAPAELLDSFARAREAINDSPSAAEEELAVWDAERVRALEAALERRDRDVRVTVALDETATRSSPSPSFVSPEPRGRPRARRTPPSFASTGARGSAAGSRASRFDACRRTGPTSLR